MVQPTQRKPKRATSLINRRRRRAVPEHRLARRAEDGTGKACLGWDSDMTAYGPKAHLASAVINWGPYYTKAVKDALDGTWTPRASLGGVKEGAIDMVSIAEDVPAEIKAKVRRSQRPA